MNIAVETDPLQFHFASADEADIAQRLWSQTREAAIRTRISKRSHSGLDNDPSFVAGVSFSGVATMLPSLSRRSSVIVSAFLVAAPP